MSSDLCLHLQHPLPCLSQLCLGLGLTQPHAHQLVLQLTQRVLPGAVLPATSGACQVTLTRGNIVSQLSITFCTLKKKKKRKESPTKIMCLSKSHVAAHLPVLFQVSDLLPQLFQAGQSFRLSQLHPNQLLLKTRHIGVIW